jgi:hypothetical protein
MGFIRKARFGENKMQDWFSNRLVINGAQEHVTEMKKLFSANLRPIHQEAIQKSRKLFVAGCAGLLRTIKPVGFQIYPQLVQAGVGANTPQNKAFTDWLILLKTEPDLNINISKEICLLYEESGLDFRSWQTLSYTEQNIASTLFSQKSGDWFDLPFTEKEVTAQQCWQMLDEKPISFGFDMRFLVPTQLFAEINGTSGNLFDYQSTFHLYHDLYETRWPHGLNVRISQHTKAEMEIDFDTLWSPPGERVISSLSEMYGCDVMHTFSGGMQKIKKC